jgi:hypothetical protein
MSTSLLYHAFSVRAFQYTRTDYRAGQVLFSIHQGEIGDSFFPRTRTPRRGLRLARRSRLYRKRPFSVKLHKGPARNTGRSRPGAGRPDGRFRDSRK